MIHQNTDSQENRNNRKPIQQKHQKKDKWQVIRTLVAELMVSASAVLFKIHAQDTPLKQLLMKKNRTYRTKKNSFQEKLSKVYFPMTLKIYSEFTCDL